MNLLFCSVGRRGQLIKYFKQTLGESDRIIATDHSPIAPALFFADVKYVVPRIDSDDYLDTIVDICKTERIDVITTFIDPEIEFLAEHRELLKSMGVLVLAPSFATAKYCFDKYEMYKYLEQSQIPTVLTFGDYNSFIDAYEKGGIDFPVFVKPRTGSGSVGARRVFNKEELREAVLSDPTLIIQENMDCYDIDSDVYIDTISREVVSIFTKNKLETRIGGASKTVSFKDERLFRFIQEIAAIFQFYGPVNMDFFYRGGEYYLSEINPRFGGGYLHAYGAGVDFVKLIMNNVNGIANKQQLGDYDENVFMMMYDSAVVEKIDNLDIGFFPDNDNQ